MRKRFTSIFIFMTYVWTICGPILAVATVSPGEVFSSMHHEDDPPCHHDNNEQEPCEDECPWFWCPGHASAIYFCQVAYFATPGLKPVFIIDLSDFVLSDGTPPRVFRPPRS